MKKHLLSILFVLVIGPVQAGAKSPYYSEQEMKEDVSLLAQASFLYKTGGESKALQASKNMCKVIDARFDATSSPTPNMKRWKSKTDQICTDY